MAGHGWSRYGEGESSKTGQSRRPAESSDTASAGDALTRDLQATMRSVEEERLTRPAIDIPGLGAPRRVMRKSTQRVRGAETASQGSSVSGGSGRRLTKEELRARKDRHEKRTKQRRREQREYATSSASGQQTAQDLLSDLGSDGRLRSDTKTGEQSRGGSSQHAEEDDPLMLEMNKMTVNTNYGAKDRRGR